MSPRRRHNGFQRSRLTYVLAAAVIAAIAIAYTSVGAASSQSSESTRTATAQYGVVQSTVSGSGTIEPVSELDLGFKTAGTVTRIYVSEGEHVKAGELIAELNPKSAEASLEQARASLQSAQASLTATEERGGETSSSGGAGAATASASSVDISLQAGGHSSSGSGEEGSGTTGSAPANEARPTTNSGSGKNGSSNGGSSNGGSSNSGSSSSGSTGSSNSGSSNSGSSSSSSTPSESAATREANLASARAAVTSDSLAVQNAEQALQDTKLYAPETGTIVSLSGEVGETVSASGTTKASSGESSSSSGSGSGAGTGRSGVGAGSTGSSGSGSSSSSSSFAVLSRLSSMQLVVSLNESEIGNVKVGQTATVTVEALNGTKLAAHVTKVALTPASGSSGVVSYDVTFQLDQLEHGIKPGMSGAAEVVVKQEEGVNVPSSAVRGSTVTVLEGSKQVRRNVATGLVGNTATLIRTGLRSGEQVVLPQVSTGTSTGSSRTSTRGSGGGAFPAGGGGFAGGGFAGGGLGAGARPGG
jgi:HlyD family secretion protein